MELDRAAMTDKKLTVAEIVNAISQKFSQGTLMQLECVLCLVNWPWSRARASLSLFDDVH